MSISKKLKELIVAFGAAQNVNALKSNRIESLIGTLAAWISEHGSGEGSITVDDALDDTSENPVQNKVITAALADKMDANEIPEATASNNGKILGVDDGAYAFVDSKAPLILSGTFVTGTAPEPDTVTITGATLAEIYAAATGGRFVAVDVPLSQFDLTCRLPLVGYDYNNDEYTLVFNGVLNGTVAGYILQVACENNLVGTSKMGAFAFNS